MDHPRHRFSHRQDHRCLIGRNLISSCLFTSRLIGRRLVFAFFIFFRLRFRVLLCRLCFGRLCGRGLGLISLTRIRIRSLLRTLLYLFCQFFISFLPFYFSSTFLLINHQPPPKYEPSWTSKVF